MQTILVAGRNASAGKYDVLSALMAHGLASDKHRQRLVLRFMSLITTRYNWQRNELVMGQREIARLWCVDERTVKRDMARLRAMEWVVVRQQGARGRVSVLGLDLQRVMLDTRAEWANIGPDFVERVGGAPAVSTSNVVPLHRPAVIVGEGLWKEACRRLADEDRVLFDTWFAGLREIGAGEGCLTLLAPSRFHANYVQTHLGDRVRTAVRRCDGSVGRVEITS